MDGFEVARAFKADESLKGIFLVAVGRSTLPEDRLRAFEAGFEHRIAKPPSLQELEGLLAILPTPGPETDQ